MKTISTLMSLVVITVHLSLFTACSSHAFKADSRLTVAVSIMPQDTLVKEVAGGLADVVTAIPPGKSPVNYAPTPQELKKLNESCIYFGIGVPSEQSSILPRLKSINSKIKIVDTAKEVKKHFPDREFSPGQRDPHIWLSPKRSAVIIDVIARELSCMDSTNADVYVKNAQNYKDKLMKLDREIRSSIDRLENKAIMVYHPSLGYFAEDYGLNMISIQSEGKDASPADLKKAIDIAEKQGIKTVFCQAEIDSRQAKVLASEISAKIVQITPLSPDYINNLKKITAEIVKSDQ
jgi:zinc transport system substrate-binding protein